MKFEKAFEKYEDVDPYFRLDLEIIRTRGKGKARNVQEEEIDKISVDRILDESGVPSSDDWNNARMMACIKINTLICRAIVLDPTNNFKYVLFTVKDLHGEENGELVEKMKNDLFRIFGRVVDQTMKNHYKKVKLLQTEKMIILER
ncbi:hypothetical protein Tsubulata_003537 [Turnera subulata]|uniref:Uncharacterized protein n=1 Tax=Turnera subulata TaxID=218843 RepID=A0A9Q0G1E9_9ROSI|nr:hypothetical protein Tsubulata_003537 [Turnera subulata]